MFYRNFTNQNNCIYVSFCIYIKKQKSLKDYKYDRQNVQH